METESIIFRSGPLVSPRDKATVALRIVADASVNKQTRYLVVRFIATSFGWLKSYLARIIALVCTKPPVANR